MKTQIITFGMKHPFRYWIQEWWAVVLSIVIATGMVLSLVADIVAAVVGKR